MAAAALHGVIPVLSTPFDVDDEIDACTLTAEIDWLVGCGVDGLAIAMVSEIVRLSDSERRDLTLLAVAAAAGRVPVVASVGCESTKASVALAEHAREAGASALMAIPPVVVALPDAQIVDYYRAILESVDLPVVVQDASGYLGRPMSIDLYVDLLSHYGPERVLFKPEAAPIGPRLSELRDATGGAARVFEGTGGISLVDSHRRGIVGTMPGPELPWALVALWRALERDDRETVDAVHGPIAGLISLQSSLDSFVAVEKYLLRQQGIFVDERRRRPYAYDLDAETKHEVDRLVALLHQVLPDPLS